MSTGPETQPLEGLDSLGELGPKTTGRKSGDDDDKSLLASARTVQDPQTFRSAMTTSRAHTAIAALAAQRTALESRLAIVEAALENEGRRQFHKPRGMGKSGSATKGGSAKGTKGKTRK